MALVANTWYTVTWTTAIPANVPPWDVTLPSVIPTAVLVAMLTASSMLIFCVGVDVFTDAIAYSGSGSTPVDIPHGVVTVTATPAMLATAMDDGSTWYSTRNGTEWLCYTAASGVFTLADSTALGAFIG